MPRKYYSLAQQDNVAELVIYGDITSWEYFDSDVSSYTLSRELADLDVDRINVYINSYGGEVAEGLAIYNTLKRSKARVVTYCDGFACSIASVVFMAGAERIMSSASMLMVHNAWTCTQGDATALRKEADDLDTIMQASINAYMSCVNLSERRLRELLDAETWITPEDAVAMGFATGIVAVGVAKHTSQSARRMIINKMLNHQPTENKLRQILADISRRRM